MSAIVVELQEQLFTLERELDSRENALTAREDDLAASECTLGRVHVECDDERDRAEAIRQHYRATLCASIAGCQHSFDFDRILRGR
jgi:hypothetical protein